MAAMGKVIATFILVLAVSMQMCCSNASAIPIWEFLTRNEKVSYLYSSFASLVSAHCKATAANTNVPVNQCKRKLAAYGYEKLQTFSEAQLELLDPFQRGANELIWSSIMRDHPSAALITTRKPIPTPPASSIIILSHQKPAHPATSPNPLFDTVVDNKHKYAMDMDIAYGYTGLPAPSSQVEIFDNNQRPNVQQLHNTGANVGAGAAVTTLQQQQKQQPETTYLTGPLVFRVRPDGTPVEEDQYRPLPKDDDLEVFQVSSSNPSNGNINGATGRPNKHRKIATISALKEQHFATMALKRELEPPLPDQRVRRQYQVSSKPFNGYFYGKGQA